MDRFHQVCYVLKNFALMGMDFDDVDGEVDRLFSDDDYLADWLITLSYPK